MPSSTGCLKLVTSKIVFRQSRVSYKTGSQTWYQTQKGQLRRHNKCDRFCFAKSSSSFITGHRGARQRLPMGKSACSQLNSDHAHIQRCVSNCQCRQGERGLEGKGWGQRVGEGDRKGGVGEEMDIKMLRIFQVMDDSGPVT